MGLVLRTPFLLAVILAAMASPSLAAQDGAVDEGWIESEVERLRGLLPALSERAATARGDALDGVLEDFESGRELWALRRLWTVRVAVEAGHHVADAPTEAPGRDALLEEVATVGGAVERESAELRARLRSGRPPAVVAALVTAALNRASSLVAGARGFAGLGSVAGARYYAAEARAEVGTSRAALAVAREASGNWPRTRGLENAVTTAEQDAVEVYRRPGMETEHHADFIVANASLKEARELVTVGAPDYDLGALLSLLEARRRLDALAAADDVDAATLRARLVSATRRLTDEGRDGTLARLFVERAEAALDGGDAPDLAEARSSLDAVDRYDRLVTSETTP